MKISGSIHSGALKTGVGNVMNNLVLRKRRLTLFFEDITNEYISQCEKNGLEKEIERESAKWGELTFESLVPATIKKLPESQITESLKASWTNLNIVGDVELQKEGELIFLSTKDESVTRNIGANEFMKGFFRGTINALYETSCRLVSAEQSKERCRYGFELTGEPVRIVGKEKELYDRLNYLEPQEGFTLSDAFKSGTFQLSENNRILFRKKKLSITENTIFHLVGNAGLMLDAMAPISNKYFGEIIDKDSTDKQKLVLLKNLLQIMGWGRVSIIIEDKDRILVEIKNPPYGLQLEEDNWTYICKTILGYVWLLDEGFTETIQRGNNKVLMTYSK